MSAKNRPSPRTISRLSFYRRLLTERIQESAEPPERIYSHELADAAGVSAAQVRRDIMELGHSGTPNNGYCIADLIADITAYIDRDGGHRVALVGIGNLGRALLAYFSLRRNTNLKIVAAFDTAAAKTGRTLHGCPCHDLAELPQRIQDSSISVGIVAVPAEAAQSTVDLLAGAGVTGILNFAPAPIQSPSGVYVRNVDICVELETVAYYAHRALG